MLGQPNDLRAICVVKSLKSAQVVLSYLPAVNRPCEHGGYSREPIVGFALARNARDLFSPIEQILADARIVQRGEWHIAELSFRGRKHPPVLSLSASRQLFCEFD